MARNMSFALTTPQFLDGSKTVTRRDGWAFAKVGDIVQGVTKSQGIRKGEKIGPLGMIRFTDVRREPLRRMIDDREYGFVECEKEGFPPPDRRSWPSQFVSFFCASHRGCTPDSEITRIEFEHIRLMPRSPATLTQPAHATHGQLIIAAIRAGCAAADIHLTCSYPDCNCKQMPKAIEAANAAYRAMILEVRG